MPEPSVKENGMARIIIFVGLIFFGWLYCVYRLAFDPKHSKTGKAIQDRVKKDWTRLDKAFSKWVKYAGKD